MSEIFEHFSLKNRNTFGIEVSSRYFFDATSLQDLLDFFMEKLKHGARFMIIGEGSNILFTSDYNGTLIHPDLKGIEILGEDADTIQVKAHAGENWDDFVKYCVAENWYGLENLSLIPGSVGSSPVQNIGAYGVEAKDRIDEIDGVYVETGKRQILKNHECRFGYRSSIFKHELKNRFLITSVTFTLDKHPDFELGYGPVEKEFLKKPVKDLSALRQTIIEIRESKLPDPRKFGNAGSFFKNPVLSDSEFSRLKNNFSGIPSYPAGKDFTKVPAAWLIEQSGWKGVREGNTGSYPTQPLVIVNYGNASGKEIYSFAKKIMESVSEKFGIDLETEVNIVD